MAAVIGNMTAEGQQALFEQTVGSSSSSGSPPASPSPSPSPSSSPSPSPGTTGSSLADVMVQLKSSIVDGSFAQAAGAPLLGLSVEVPAVQASTGSGGSSGSTTLTLQDILREAGNSSPGGSQRKLGFGGIIGIAVGVAAAACLAGAAALVILRRRRTASLLSAAMAQYGMNAANADGDVESPPRRSLLMRGRQLTQVHPAPQTVFLDNVLYEQAPVDSPPASPPSPSSPVALLSASDGAHPAAVRPTWHL